MEHLKTVLKESDPQIYSLSIEEMLRQKQSLELIASENFASKSTLSALSTHFNNKYAEGYPHARHYGGCEVVDKLEELTRQRALAVFHLDNKEWGVNVQPLSGTPANVAVYTALLQPGDTLMGMKLEDGGHLSHGFKTSKRKVSASSIFWNSISYSVRPDTYLIDYDKLIEKAKNKKPKLIIAGASAYPRNIDYKLFRKAADQSGSFLMTDMAHISGLVAAGLSPDPFAYSDIVTTTTHKTLRGPRGALIFYRKKFEKEINRAVFPGLQGGPHMHQIAAIAVALKEAMDPEFKNYQKQVLKNMQIMCKELKNAGINLITGGTDNHLALLDLRKQKIGGKKVEYVLSKMNISTNKNSIPYSKISGLRVGSPALTTRGFKEEDFKKVSKYLVKGIEIAQKISKESGKKFKDFTAAVMKNKEIPLLREEIIEYASKFPLPGMD